MGRSTRVLVEQNSSRRQFLAATGIVATSAIAGCLGDDDIEGEDDYPQDAMFDELGIGSFELLDRRHDPPEKIAYVHDDHWDGGNPTIEVGETLSVGAHVDNEDGDRVHLGDEYTLEAYVAPGATEGILSFDYHGDHVHLVGEESGVTEIVMLLVTDDVAVYQSPSIVVQVTDDHDHDHHEEFDAHHVDEVSVYDRAFDPHEQVADWHDELWHGAIPTVPLDDYISLGAVFVDADGTEADLSHDYELRVSLAEGADEIVSFDFHGDHVHIIGQEAGSTSVVFELWHDDHVDFTTTPIELTVSEE